MPLFNTTDRWGAVAKFFHWTIVVLIIVQYVLAETAEDLALGRQKFTVLATHKSIGLTIFALAVLRLLWRFMNKVPSLPDTLKPYERFLAHTTHAALYVFLFAQPITGWMLSSASNFPVSWFGLFTLPNLVGRDRALADDLHDVHETLFTCLVVIAALHILGALKHHFWYKDNVLKRMLPFTALGAVVVSSLLLSSMASAATAYGLDPAKSTLGFVVTQSDGDVEGQFAKFKAHLLFSPEDLAKSHFDVVVDTASVDTGDDDRDEAVKGPDLLDVAKYRTALFESTGFVHKSGNEYEGTGKLTMRGVTRDIKLPFTWQTAQEGGETVAYLEGQTSVDRLDFGVGQGDWKDTDIVANEVKVKYSLRLTPAVAKRAAAPSAPAQKPADATAETRLRESPK